MKIEFHPEATRGFADHGWLKAKHSFSFASWQNRNRMHFGALRVFNDDIVAPGMGFGKHPHDNMEIITIPLRGQLKHEDSMGFSEVVKAGEVQVMSAGTGIFHSEFNASNKEDINLFQIWIFPNVQEVAPRYGQFTYDVSASQNNFLQLVSPDPEDEGMWIHQDAWIHLIEMDENTTQKYHFKNPRSGVYCMNIEGHKAIGENQFGFRDAAGIWETDAFEIHAFQKGRMLLIEIPMQF